MSLLHEPEILSEVPQSFKRLIRYITRGFYGIEHALIIDMLVRNPCMKEDDMLQLLKFERKQLRSHIKMLKNDKFLKERMKVETDTEGRTTRHSYYFINYHIFINVVKYKLDHMRRKIEMEERDSTNRASFKCPSCEKTYTDLEANQLFDMMTGTFRCTYCQSEVEEEATSKPTADARTLMVKFNEQIEPIYMLLKECEDVKLAPEILEPEPTDIKHLTRERSNETSHTKTLNERTVWSGEANKNINYGYTENQVTVNVDDSNQSISAETKPVKERPIWMVESTVEGAVSEPTFRSDKILPSSTLDETSNMSDKNDIMQTLLAHEKRTGSALVPGVPRAPGSDDESSTSESEDEGYKPPTAAAAAASAEVEEMESEEEVPMVTIGNTKVAYHDVTDEMVNRMTAQEKAAYIQLGQEMYEDMYE